MVGGLIGISSEVVRPHVLVLRVGRIQEVALLIFEDILPEALSVTETALQVHLLDKPPNANLD